MHPTWKFQVIKITQMHLIDLSHLSMYFTNSTIQVRRLQNSDQYGTLA